MKTAVSIPDDIFRAASDAADRLGWSRSQLYAHALRAFLETQGDDPVTVALDALADAEPAPDAAAGRALIDRGGWQW